MPIYEYCCNDCGRDFETLVLSAGEKVQCPKCASPKVEKRMSCFSSVNAGDGPGAASSGCGSSGGFS